MSSVEQLFAQNPVFAALPPAKRECLIRDASVRSYRKGEVITHLGDDWPYLFIIAEGSVSALKKSLEGRSLVVATFVRGDIFWGLAFFHQDMPMPVALEAVEPTTIHLWSGERIHPLFKEEGRMSWELARLMILRMARASQILEEMAFQPVASRLAKLIMETSQKGRQDAISRSLTLDEMAARIGSTREVVCRFLHRFADDGIIDITRTEYRITDLERLAGISQSSKG